MKRASFPEIGDRLERLLTMPQFAAEIGVQAFKVRCAVKNGDIPTVTVGNSRKLIRLGDGLAAIERTRKGASK